MHRVSSGDSEERLAERVAELLRPRVGLSGLPLDGAAAGAPLVNINVNTNTGGVTSLGGGGGGDASSGPPPARTELEAASMSTDLYARLMQALSAKGGGGEPDASLRDAAAHFVDELTKQVPTMGTRESLPPLSAEATAGESAHIESAALEALPVDRMDESVTSAAKAAGLDELLYRAALAAARGDARVSEAKDAVPRWARSKAARDAERVGEPFFSRASSATETEKKPNALDALDIPTSLAPTDAELEAARSKLEKAERDETAFAARLEADATDASALDIPDARREFLVAEREAKALAREEEEGGTKVSSRAQKSAWTAPDPLDEDPEGAELAGIDGVIRTAEAMSEVWAADPKMRVGGKADAPAAVASRTDVLRANVPLKDASRSRRKKSTLGETKRDGDELAGDDKETRSTIGSLLRELGV